MENAEGTIGFCSAWGCGGAPHLSGSWVGVPGAVPRPAGAQSWAAVTGTMVEAEGGTALVGAHVLLRSAASAEVVRQTATDACGDFAFDRVRPGRYVVKVQQLGYTPSARHALRAGTPVPSVPGVHLTLTAKNVLGNEHREFVGAPELGRFVTVRLTYAP